MMDGFAPPPASAEWDQRADYFDVLWSRVWKRYGEDFMVQYLVYAGIAPPEVEAFEEERMVRNNRERVLK